MRAVTYSILPSLLVPFLSYAFAHPHRFSIAAAAQDHLLPHIHRRTYAPKIAIRSNTKATIGLEPFHPVSTYETFGDGLPSPPSFTGSLENDAMEFVRSRLAVSAENVRYESGYARTEATSGGEGLQAETRKYAFAYLKQMHNGIRFANAVANVAWKDGKVVSFGSSFVVPKRIASSAPSITVVEAKRAAEAGLSAQYNGHPVSLEYLVLPDSSVALTYVVQVQGEDLDSWYEVFVDAHSRNILSTTDFVSHATYVAIPMDKPTAGSGQSPIHDPQDLETSPSGWHANGALITTYTSGNNAHAFQGLRSSTTGESAPDLVFNYIYNHTLEPGAEININASRVNAFFVANAVHDLTYRYGFTEDAFNFQNNNFGKGGKGNDALLVSVQDTGGINNAQFSCPPEGQSGFARMFIWNQATPSRDSALENCVLIHEITHGITNRLTGGGTARCLQTTEARGLGEGWSDALADWIQQTSENITDFVVAAYLYNSPYGIRRYPYSTSKTLNPQLYSNVPDTPLVHRIGEVWANILHNVLADLVAEYGFSPNAKNDASGNEGNVVFLHLFLTSLALHPCNPTFVTTRDAWIQADINRYDGIHQCLLWKSFAERGLGLHAADYVDDYTVPDDCI